MITFIGVDPAFRDNGFYLCTILDNMVEFSKMNTFIDFVSFIDKLDAAGMESYICIENSNETNHTFISKNIRSQLAREKISRDVGKNQAISQMSVDYCKYRLNNSKIFSISPAEKGMKWNNAQFKDTIKKLNQDSVNYGKGNQDKRDAYKLALLARYKRILELNTKKI